MAVTKVKDDNIVQAMLQAKSDAIDTWGEYQAKRIKHHLVELGRDQTLALRAGAAAQSTTQLENQAQHYQTEIARYEEEEGALQKKARAFEAFQVLGNGFVAGELFTIIGGDSMHTVSYRP